MSWLVRIIHAYSLPLPTGDYCNSKRYIWFSGLHMHDAGVLNKASILIVLTNSPRQAVKNNIHKPSPRTDYVYSLKYQK